MAAEREKAPNIVIKEYVEQDGPQDWKHRQMVQFLYRVFDAARFCFFSPRDESQLVLPQSVIAVDDMRHEVLAAYRISYNPTGLPFEIMMNAKWIGRPRWELCESLIHEEVHLFQEYMADQGVDGYEHCKGGYHNRQFVELCEQVGLHPILGVGAHWGPAGGQFARLMELLGVEKPAHAEGEFKKPEGKVKGKPYWWDADRGKVKGTSTLILYTVDGCPRIPGCKVRSGRRDLQLACMTCGGHFEPH